MAQNDDAGKRFADVRHWLDISHRAIGMLAHERGVQMNKTLWANWEARPNFPESSRATISAVVDAIAARLEGGTEKWSSQILAMLDGTKKVPKDTAPWLLNKKPVLQRGRKAGSQKPVLQVIEGGGSEPRGVVMSPEVLAIATEVVVEQMEPGAPPLPDKIRSLIKAILSSQAKKALPVLLLFWLSLLPTPVQAAETGEESNRTDQEVTGTLMRFPGLPRRKRKKLG